MKSALKEVVKPAIVFTIIVIMLYNVHSYNESKKELEYLDTLHKLGYPESGYVLFASTSIEPRAASFTVTHTYTIIKYADGEAVMIDDDGDAQVFTVDITQARAAAASYINKFTRSGIWIDLDHFTETYKDAAYYYVFTVYYHDGKIGLLYVNRETGKVFFKDRLQELIEELKRGDSNE